MVVDEVCYVKDALADGDIARLLRAVRVHKLLLQYGRKRSARHVECGAEAVGDVGSCTEVSERVLVLAQVDKRVRVGVLSLNRM